MAMPFFVLVRGLVTDTSKSQLDVTLYVPGETVVDLYSISDRAVLLNYR